MPTRVEAGASPPRAAIADVRTRAGWRSFDWTMPFSAAMVLLLAALVLLPLFWLALTSVQDDAKAFALAHYRQLFVDPAFVRPLWTTLWTSAAVGIACIVAAAPMAWLVSRTD